MKTNTLLYLFGKYEAKHLVNFTGNSEMRSSALPKGDKIYLLTPEAHL